MLEMLFEAMYEAPMIPYIPSAIYSASEGRNHELWKSVLLWESVIEVLLIRGANLAVSCSDGRLPDECGDWPVAIDLNPVSSTLPVLVLNGEFDSVTPLESGHHVAETLPRSFIYVFPGLGHWVNGSGHPCQMSVIQEFLEDPHHPPAVECMTEMSGPDFVVEP
jgi:pimeloyl-ACP methyl ester carboxylesterase